MSIQQDINSALGQVGVLATLNPTVQARAKDREELKKIEKKEEALNKQFASAREGYFKERGFQEEWEKAEIKAAKDKGKKPKVLLAPELYKESVGQAVGNVRDIAKKKERLAQEKFDIDPSDENYRQLTRAQNVSKTWETNQQTVVGKPATDEGQIAWEAIERARQRQENARANRERRTKLLYGEMERMMPGFKYMEPKKQNQILYKSMDDKERKRIKDEAERREKYYGK